MFFFFCLTNTSGSAFQSSSDPPNIGQNVIHVVCDSSCQKCDWLSENNLGQTFHVSNMGRKKHIEY